MGNKKQTSVQTSPLWKARFFSEKQTIDLGEIEAVTTGIACHLDHRFALDSAKRNAKFNLRALLGNERVKITYRIIEQYPDQYQTCFKVLAQSKEFNPPKKELHF